MLRRVGKSVAVSAAAASAVGVAALYVDAPRSDVGDGRYEEHHHTQVFPEWLHDLGRAPIFAAATLASKVYLLGLNRTEVQGSDILIDQLEKKPKKTSLITVSNHSATVDDPGVIAT